MILILVRHGITPWNEERRIQGLTDIDLSAAGLDQVRRLALSLKDFPIASIYSSPLVRARKTAEIINEFHLAPLHLSSDLTEMNYGDFEGLTIPELMAHHRDFLRKWLADPASVGMPNGESFLDVQIRAWKIVEGILANSRNTLVVAHNFTLASILCRIKNLPLTEFRSLCVDPASRTVIRFCNGSADIELFNDRPYLNGRQR
ncbi:MAG: histidine phosphatase family protein [Syntrophus sp. (in: bacteria)]|nr:histidine phosphatase family protein [Syntrophus sp. (in: bacteria)]